MTDRTAPGSRPTAARKGIIYVVSAPSGAGKTSLCKQLLATFPELTVSVSYTTRPRREGERDGVDYHFVSEDQFRRMVEDGAFAEWASVHDNYYGTAVETLEQARLHGRDILLDIDCQGAAQLKERLGHAVFIFILPPGIEELKRRLQGRNTEPAEVMERRVANARHELREARWYDYIVVNDNFDFALSQLKAILMAETCRTEVALPSVQDIVQGQLEKRS